MKLSEKQQTFVFDVSLLIQYANARGIRLTFGHAWRSEEEQKRLVKEGKSKTMDSKHLQRLAIDFNFFIKGELTYDKDQLQSLGDFWENLRPGINKWGGNWKSFVDTPHFEAKY